MEQQPDLGAADVTGGAGPIANTALIRFDNLATWSANAKAQVPDFGGNRALDVAEAQVTLLSWGEREHQVLIPVYSVIHGVKIGEQ
jgi:hypothetical protein